MRCIAYNSISKSIPPGPSHAQRPEDRIILIALSDNRGWHRILGGRQCSEPAMLAELVHLLRNVTRTSSKVTTFTPLTWPTS